MKTTQTASINNLSSLLDTIEAQLLRLHAAHGAAFESAEAAEARGETWIAKMWDAKSERIDEEIRALLRAQASLNATFNASLEAA